jgi:hypothetical protein
MPPAVMSLWASTRTLILLSKDRQHSQRSKMTGTVILSWFPFSFEAMMGWPRHGRQGLQMSPLPPFK